MDVNTRNVAGRIEVSVHSGRSLGSESGVIDHKQDYERIQEQRTLAYQGGKKILEVRN